MTANRGLLFDIDGVLLDTGGFFDEVWRDWALARSLDPALVVPRTRGRRTAEVLRNVAPHLDPGREQAILDEMVRARLGLVRPADGATALLQALERERAPWAVASSGSRWFAQRCFRQTGLPFPRVGIFAEDVREGKPAPDCYLTAARLLGLAPRACLVIEDAPAGVTAARRAGCAVLALATTVPAARLEDADFCYPSLAAADDALREFVRAGTIKRKETHNA
jgi:mannitol-1-/sugar-/sorbitol-6-phosphatase